MNFRKLLTYLTVSTAAVIPFAGAQNPTILQGSYISNVFGNSNFVLNPNAQTNIANVTTVTATVTRSTTTPLVATSEFNVAIGTANGTATWATRAFDSGMKGQNCEARFSYRGFAATSKVHIKQGANTVASLNLTPATDPRIASINFPCGDLSTATTFQVTDTAILAGTNEIGGIYVGLATNMANVAQAEVVVQAGRNTTQSIGTAATTIIWNTESLDTYGEFDTSTGIFTAKRAGRYEINAAAMFDSVSFATDYRIDFIIRKNNNAVSNQLEQQQVTSTRFWRVQNTAIVDLAVGEDIRVTAGVTSGTRNLFGDTGGEYNRLSIKRFPSSSELVVTPERQNTFAAASWTGNAHFNRSNTTEFTISDGVFATNRTAFGKAEFTTTANDVAIKVPQMPPGTYKIELTAENMRVQQSSAGTLDANCKWYLKDGTNTASAQSVLYGIQYAIEAVSTATQIVKYTSLADRTFTASAQSATTNATACAINAPKIIITPLDQPSNSALYVEGPVKAAATGAAIPAGYVGEMRANEADTCGTSGVYGDGASITVTPGVWRVNLYANLQAGVSVNDFVSWVGPTPGASLTWRASFYNDGWIGGWTLGKVSIAPPVQLIRYDGTNFYRYRNGAWTDAVASATGILYAKRYRDSSACGSLITVLSAERIN